MPGEAAAIITAVGGGLAAIVGAGGAAVAGVAQVTKDEEGKSFPRLQKFLFGDKSKEERTMQDYAPLILVGVGIISLGFIIYQSTGKKTRKRG